MNKQRNDRNPRTNHKPQATCWDAVASDPERLRYWREIARLWRGSLAVDTTLVTHRR